MHGREMCVVALAEDLEARALKSSAQTKAPGNTPRTKARPTEDGRPGLQAYRDSGSGTIGVERIGSDGKPGAFSLFRERRSSRKSPRFNDMCITAVLLYQ